MTFLRGNVFALARCTSFNFILFLSIQNLSPYSVFRNHFSHKKKMNFIKTKTAFINLLKLHHSNFRAISDVQKKIKQSYYFTPGDFLLSCSTVGQILDEAATKSGDKTAFISAQQGISKTFSEFRDEVNRVASGLISCGLRRGDRIGICSTSCYEWPVIQYAAAKAGLILVNANPVSQPSEIEYLLKKVDCKALVMSEFSKGRTFYDIICEIIPELPISSAGKLQSSKFPNLKNIIMLSEQRPEGTLIYKDISNMGNKESNEMLSSIERTVQFDDPVNIQLTSGTTGMPKGALLSHHNIVNNALVFGRKYGYHYMERVICCQVPLFHCFGCVLGNLGSVLFQQTCIFPSSVYNPTETLQTIQEYKCTTVYGTPPRYFDMINVYNSQKFEVPSLKQAVIGGAPSPEVLVQDLRHKLNLDYVHIAYGSTENSPAVATNGLNDDFQNAVTGTIKPAEYIEVKVVDDKRRLVPVNTEGELCVRGHGLFLGYWNDKEKTEEVVDKTNWYHTGDLCEMNEYGFIRIVGRKKDMIIRGGENIYPAEIENMLNTHPAVLEVHVVGVPDERMGEEACAWIKLEQDTDCTEEEIKKFCKGKISHFKIPHYVRFVQDFPKTASGKIRKVEMKKISTEKLNL